MDELTSVSIRLHSALIGFLFGFLVNETDDG